MKHARQHSAPITRCGVPSGRFYEAWDEVRNTFKEGDMNEPAATGNQWDRIAGTSQALVRSRLEIARILEAIAARRMPLHRQQLARRPL